MVLFTQVTGMLQSFNEYVSLYLQYIHAPSWRSFVLLAMETPVYYAIYCEITSVHSHNIIIN